MCCIWFPRPLVESTVSFILGGLFLIYLAPSSFYPDSHHLLKNLKQRINK